MRKLNIASSNAAVLNLEVDLPAEYLFVQQLAKQHAETQNAFNEMCLTGLKAAQNYKAEVDPRRYDSRVFWVVRTAISKLKSEK